MIDPTTGKLRKYKYIPVALSVRCFTTGFRFISYRRTVSPIGHSHEVIQTTKKHPNKNNFVHKLAIQFRVQ